MNTREQELTRAFKLGFQKEAAVPWRGIGAGALTAAGLAGMGFGVRDLMKARGHSESLNKMTQRIEDYEGEEEFPDEIGGKPAQRLRSRGDVWESDLPFFAKLPFMIVGASDPAYFKANDQHHITGSGNLPPEVLQHEIGHAKEDHVDSDIGFLDSLLIIADKSTYDKHIMKREQEAWDHVQEDLLHKEEMMNAGLDTYDKAFYAGRGASALGLGLAAALTGAEYFI